MALNYLESLERKLQKILEFAKLYKNKIEEYIPLDYALTVSIEEATKNSDITKNKESPCSFPSVCQVSQYLT